MRSIGRLMLALLCAAVFVLGLQVLIEGPQAEAAPAPATEAEQSFSPREMLPAEPGSSVPELRKAADRALLPAGAASPSPAAVFECIGCLRLGYRRSAWQAFPPEGRFG